MVPDQIEREIHIEAPIDRVWRLMTEAEHLGTWFGDAGAEIDLRPGGAMRLKWEKYGTVECEVVAVDPPTKFSYRWQEQLVEFTLTPVDDGTRVKVLESGFATGSGTDGDRTERFQANTDGWKQELGELVEYASKVPAQK